MPSPALSRSTWSDEIVCVVGAGYVGLTTAVGLAEDGRHVRLVEIDEARLRLLRDGRAPIHEPGLEEVLTRVLRTGHLRVVGDIHEGMDGAGIGVIAVGTPPTVDGEADLRQVERALAQASAAAVDGAVLVIKSTVPPGTTARLAAGRRHGRGAPSLVMCPEFLREGTALEDLRRPARLVVGGDDRQACARVAALFARDGAATHITDSTSAELVKYGSNSFLALKISFINELAQLCEATGADIESVADGIGADPRIGRSFLNAGLGYGGSCFPKDVRALENVAAYHGQSFWMLKAAIDVNAQQRRRFVGKVVSALGGSVEGSRIAVLGLAFKPGTDDMRQAASIDIIRHLVDLGAVVTATDPVAIQRATPLLPSVSMVADPYACVTGADAVVIVTEWAEFRNLDWDRVGRLASRRLVVDGRNCLDGHDLARLGYTYVSVGRRARTPD
jgi:UDPglucose 6-dehydrogenase